MRAGFWIRYQAMFFSLCQRQVRGLNVRHFPSPYFDRQGFPSIYTAECVRASGKR